MATVAALAVLAGAVAASDPPLEGRDPDGGGRLVPAVEAAFELESYRPGQRARLVVDDPADVTLRIFHAGPERMETRHDAVMKGVAVTAPRTVRTAGGGRTVSLRVGDWDSGLYFARLTAPDGRVGFAPFVVSPRRIGERRVAVVLPTLTWQAYNFRDDDGDGRPDSWYADPHRYRVKLGRAHLDRGVPYGFRYHLGFLHWLHWTSKQVDVLAQSDLEQVASGDALARAYDLIVFAGHHEYATAREYDLVERYRDRGGNLMFLSANNFYWRVERRHDMVEKSGRWRELRRPEASLVGVQYFAHQRSPRGSWIVRRTAASKWIFAGTGLHAGLSFGRGGVELDHVTAASPENVQVVAEIPDLFGPGQTAQMTYYRTPGGAQVFAAGAFHLTRSVTSDPVVWRMLENIWQKMTRG